MADVAGWIAYAALRGDTIVDEPATAQALVRAQDYIRAEYPEAPTGETVTDEATYIAAGFELATPGFWSIVAKPTDAKVLTEVGTSIKWTPVATGGVKALVPRSNIIDGLLRPFTIPGILSV